MRGKFFAAASAGLLFLILIFLVRNVDVAAIGPEGTSVGLSQINQAVSDWFGVNFAWYDITEVLGYAALLVALGFALTGLVQLLRRKSFGRIDKPILALGILYVCVFAVYALFEVLVVNYRPIVMPGDAFPEASFPSSHTMLAFTILGSTAILLKRFVANRGIRIAAQALCVAVIAVIVCGRLASGVHWFTDILGGVLISAALLFMFSGLLERLEASGGKRPARRRAS